MKKLFIAAMALATIVSCSKDEAGDAVLESSKKAIEITISNYMPDTRAITNPTATEVTANEKVGTIEDFTTAGTDENPLVAAAAEQLVVLFANNANKVEHAYALSGEKAGTDGTYTFHNINESVTQVAVVRKVNVADGAYSYDTNAPGFVGTDLATYKTAALTEYTDNRSIEWMDLFAASGQLTQKEQCTVTPNDHTQGYTYWLYKAEVDVKPMLARVEITNVQCTDLGKTTAAAAAGQQVSGGYDHLTLGTLTFGTNKTYDFKNYILKGAYCGTAQVEGAVCDDAAKNYYDAIYNGTANNGKVIAWDISVNTPYPTVKQVTETQENEDGTTTTVTKDAIDANPLTIAMTAFAHDYTVVNTGKQLSVGFKGAEKFEAGHIYQIAIPFTESNLDKSNEAICVNVNVKIANWVVVPLTPVFGNE